MHTEREGELMRIVGSKAAVAFAVEVRWPEGPAVEIWVGGQCVTPFDVRPYLPAFLHRLEASEAHLRRPDTFLHHEGELSGLSIREGFSLLAGEGAPGLHRALRWLD
jgi:hypothetical protein